MEPASRTSSTRPCGSLGNCRPRPPAAGSHEAGLRGDPRIARMGRTRRVSHKEHKDRKEEREPGFGLVRRAHGPGCGADLRGFSIPPSIILPPPFCRRPQASPRTRAAPAIRAETHPACRPSWTRNPSTCSPFHPFRPRPPVPHAPCRPPPSALCALPSAPPLPWLQKNPTVRFPPRPPVLSSPHVRSIRISSAPFAAASRRFAGRGFDGLSSHRPAPAPPSASLQLRLSFPTARGAGLPACRFLGPPAPGRLDWFTPNSRLQGL